MSTRAPSLGIALIAVLALSLAGCSSAPSTDDGPPAAAPSGPPPADPVPRSEPRSRYGNPQSYVVFGQRYHVMESAAGYRERGVASWYGTKFHGRRTSSGETYDMHKMTAAHKSLPLPTYVQVTNLRTGAEIVVRVNDRGPFHDNRIIDLSYAAATKLGIVAKGTGLVEVRSIDTIAPPRATQVAAQSTPVPIMVPPAAAPAPAAAVVQASGAPRIYLQAGAFVQGSNAQRLRARLASSLDAPVSVQQLDSATLPMHRVRIGPLADVATADRLARQVVEAGMTLPQIVID